MTYSNRRRFTVFMATACSLGWHTAQAQKAAPAGPPRTATWDELMPKDWDPLKQLKGRNVGRVAEGSAAEQEMMGEMRELWDNAPTRAELDGARLRLPGYVVPLDGGEQIREFLLVPYFGACIHTPPPPANQIIHAVSAKPLTKMRTMDTVWVTGTLTLTRSETSWGNAGYRLTVDKVTPYEAPPPKK